MLRIAASTRRVREEFASGEYFQSALVVSKRTVAVYEQKKAEARSGLPPLSREKHRYGFIGMYMGSLGLPTSTL